MKKIKQSWRDAIADATLTLVRQSMNYSFYKCFDKAQFELERFQKILESVLPAVKEKIDVPGWTSTYGHEQIPNQNVFVQIEKDWKRDEGFFNPKMKAVHFALVEIRNAATSVNAQKNVVEAVVRVNKLHDNVQKLANEIKVKSELVVMYKQSAHNIALYTTAAAAEKTANEMLKTLEKIVLGVLD